MFRVYVFNSSYTYLSSFLIYISRHAKCDQKPTFERGFILTDNRYAETRTLHDVIMSRNYFGGKHTCLTRLFYKTGK